MGLLIALQLQSFPIWVFLTLLCALCLPMPKPTGHWLKRALAETGYGCLRAIIAPILALGILVIGQVSGALLQGAVAASANSPAPIERTVPKERSA